MPDWRVLDWAIARAWDGPAPIQGRPPFWVVQVLVDIPHTIANGYLTCAGEIDLNRGRLKEHCRFPSEEAAELAVATAQLTGWPLHTTKERT